MEKSTTTPARKFKVGENVLVKTASKHFGWLSEMQERVGKQGVISEFYCEDEKINGEYGYRIDGWVWPESVLEKQFSPKPGDKIICNNGEEFVCCTLEFLQATISEGIRSDKPILGYYKCDDDESWQDWDEYGLTMYCPDCTYTIKEIIPASQQEVKQEVTEVIPAQGDNTALRSLRANESPCDVGAVFQEKTYTLALIRNLFLEIVGRYDDGEEWNIGAVFKEVQEQLEGDYQQYLELKAKFEGKT